MHAFRTLFLALVAFIFCAAQAGAQLSDEPTDRYYRAFLMANDAENLAKAGNVQAALEKYKKAQASFDDIVKTAPAYSPDMLAMRRGKVADAIAALQEKMNATPAPAPAPGPAPAPAQVQGGATSINGQMGVPSVAPSPTPAVAAPGHVPTVEEAMGIVRSAFEAQTQALKKELTDTQVQVSRYVVAYETALKQRDQVSSMYTTLGQTATSQQAKIAELEKQAAGGGPAKAELEKVRAEYEDTKAKLADYKDRVAKAEAMVMGNTKEMMANSEKVTTLQRERDELAKKLEAVGKDNETLQKQLAEVTKERDAANAKNLGMQAAGPVPPELKDMAAENERLRKELDDANKQLTQMKSDSATKDKEIAQLKTQIGAIQGELVALKKENAAYESQVSELTLNLKKLRAEMDDPKKASPAEATQLLAEQQMLRTIILRQLRQQARQQQQKSAVIAEIQKTENASKDLLDKVEQLAGNKFNLTEDEQKLFTTPQLQEITGEGGITATIMASSNKSGKTDKVAEKPASGMDAVDTLLEKANAFLSSNKFAEAATSYSDVLRADPKNSSGFAGLAMAKIQLNKLDEAEVTLKKSLAYNPTSANTHYLLGVTLFRRNSLNEALSSFQKCLDIDGKNARARHYLGVIASKMGLADRAEREFKATLAIDPTYSEAYFNLAVLYVTWDPPKWDEARKNYKEALRLGMKSDTNLEKILNSGAK